MSASIRHERASATLASLTNQDYTKRQPTAGRDGQTHAASATSSCFGLLSMALGGARTLEMSARVYFVKCRTRRVACKYYMKLQLATCLHVPRRKPDRISSGTAEAPLSSYKVLQRVAKGPLPMVFTSMEDIEALRILKDGGWVKASFSAAAGRVGTATVTELTPLGRFAMQFVQPDDKDTP
ncbi:hypothetical protein [Variovorax sp. PBL-H6]|uniref:hypothetical protein n=1 Tax=Variovorax sp. PBL-H6 TaxID=434009 RepID=UPI0013A57AB8|nr:hypothetical protein [Variovorax sp. PBL-H6]